MTNLQHPLTSIHRQTRPNRKRKQKNAKTPITALTCEYTFSGCLDRMTRASSQSRRLLPVVGHQMNPFCQDKRKS